MIGCCDEGQSFDSCTITHFTSHRGLPRQPMPHRLLADTCLGSPVAASCEISALCREALSPIARRAASPPVEYRGGLSGDTVFCIISF